MKRIDCLPSHQRELCVRFRDWLVEENDNSERNWINYFKIISMFSEHIGNKRFQDVTKEDVLSFLDKRKKSIEEDPDQKWIVTWNGYLARLLGFFRWLNNDKEKDREDWITPELFSSIKRKKNKRISSYTPNDVWNIDELLTVVKYCSNIRDKAILTIAWDMAARNHEMVRLRLKDIVFKEKYSL
jgi:integrase